MTSYTIAPDFSHALLLKLLHLLADYASSQKLAAESAYDSDNTQFYDGYEIAVGVVEHAITHGIKAAILERYEQEEE